MYVSVSGDVRWGTRSHTTKSKQQKHHNPPYPPTHTPKIHTQKTTIKQVKELEAAVQEREGLLARAQAERAQAAKQVRASLSLSPCFLFPFPLSACRVWLDTWCTL